MYILECIFCLWICVISRVMAVSKCPYVDRVVLGATHFQPCPEHPTLPNSLANMSSNWDLFTNFNYQNGAIILTEPFDQGAIIRTVSRQCDFHKKQCSEDIVMETNNFCDVMTQESPIWTPLFKQIDNFVPNCPIPAGSYTINKATLDRPSVYDKTDLVGNWHVDIKVINKDKLVFCQVLTTEFLKLHMRRCH